MWCTRWFLPLLLLPLPTAPPFFLVLFLLSLTMHAKPCFYCIILLTTLFVSSCYWQPFPMDNPLTTPWADNVTTFAQALNATLKQNYSQPLPTVMRAIDRCWCDFSTGSFFEPFNVSRWEYLSVQRVAKELLDEDKETSRNETEQSFSSVNDTTEASSHVTASKPKFWWLRSFSSKTSSSVEPSSTEVSSTVEQEDDTVEDQSSSQIHISPPESLHALPFLQKEYDLRQINLGMIIDLGWS